MPRKPGGKYKGKVGRAKGEATIAAELEAKRRKAYEANLARLQERRAQDLLAEHGMQSAEEEAQALKMAKIAQMFGSGKKGTLTKFWKNWKIGIVNMRREKAIEERKTCWRRSCDFCEVVPIRLAHRHNEFGLPHRHTCKHWWNDSLGRTHLGDEMRPIEAARDRPDVVNDYRQCTCCGADTGQVGLGCRTWHGLRNVGFMSPSDVKQKTGFKATRFQFPAPAMMAGLKGSSSSPALRSWSPRNPGHSLSIDENWASLRNSTSSDGVLEYDPTMPFVMSSHQAAEEERRGWSDSLSAMSGSPWTRKRSGQLCLPALPPSMPLSPKQTDRGELLNEVAHWRTGQKTMLDNHMMKMYVVGVQ